MKYYVYAGYYENFISGHKLPKPYTLRDEFKTFDEALDYVWENWEDDDIFFTEDVIDDAIDNGVIDDENWEDYLMKESKKSARKSIKESINANSILSKVETIVGKTKIKHPKAEIIELDGTKYIYYSYFDRGFDDDALDRVWDKCSDLKGVVDVGFGYGYGLENTKYENSLLIELDDDVIVESKKSARKSIKESRGQTVAELLQNASIKTIVHIYNDSTSDEFVGTNDQLKGEFSRFLYYTVSVWNIGNDKIVNIYCY